MVVNVNLSRDVVKCPECNAWTRVLESRNTYRRRECANLHRFWTHEALVSEAELEQVKKDWYHAQYMRKKLKK